jgi:hypothetical protein
MFGYCGGLAHLKRADTDRSRGVHSKLILHPSFRQTISEIGSLKVRLPSLPSRLELDFSLYDYPPNGKLVSKIEEVQHLQLDACNGQALCSQLSICAYDESIVKFQALEGTAYLTSHSLVVDGRDDFLPSNELTLYFYTRSQALAEKREYVKYSLDPETESKRDYVTDRQRFLVDYVPKNSLVLIDGPLIGGQISTKTVELNDLLLGKETVPVFFVKNSTSNLVTDYITELRGKYNSDMHWAYQYLKPGERTGLFRYVEQGHETHAKVFCYVKAFDASPQRFEMDLKAFTKHSGEIAGLLDMIYYLLLVQGDLANPQLRPIAIAEKYARSTLNLIDLSRIMRQFVTPTMNQERFPW